MSQGVLVHVHLPSLGRGYMNKPKIPGGSCEILPLQWCIVWSAYREGIINWLAFKVWCAAWLIQASRCKQKKDGTPYRFQRSELQKFFKRREKKSLCETLHALEAANILRFADTEIWFAAHLDDIKDESVKARASTIFLQLHAHTRTRCMHCPRRLLKLITQCGQKVVRVATLIGLLFTTMLVKRYDDYRGCCKAEWIAHLFGVNAKGVNTERAKLIREGLFRRLTTSQPIRQKYGEWVVLNLAVTRLPQPRKNAAESPLHAQPLHPGSSPNGQPLQNQILSSHEEISSNQQSASSEETGAYKHKNLLEPTWDNIILEDLQNTVRSEALRQVAIKRGYLTDTPPAHLHFFAAIEHSKRVATKNPAGLLRTIVEKGLWYVLTQVDEDHALSRLQRLAGAQEAAPVLRADESLLMVQQTDRIEQGDTSSMALSKDALTVQTLTADLSRVGCMGDVLTTVQQHGYLRDWTTSRWARAAGELVQARRYMHRSRGSWSRSYDPPHGGDNAYAMRFTSVPTCLRFPEYATL